MKPPAVGLILLAAGESSRLGRPKQLLAIDGQSMLRHCTTTALRSVCRPVAVVLGSRAAEMEKELTGLPVLIVKHPKWRDGLGSSIRAGLKALLQARPKPAAVALMLCDQPLVTAPLLNRLAAAVRAGRSLAASEYGGTLGVPAVFGAAHYDELLALPPDAGAKSILLRHAAAAAQVPFPGGAVDVDTEEDVAALSTRRGVSVREKIGQMLLLGFRGHEPLEKGPIVRDIVERNLGGVILYDEEMTGRARTKRNIRSPAQVRALVESLQRFAKTPLLVAIDQEGGRVNRLKPSAGFPPTLSHEELGDINDPRTTFAEADKIAQTLAGLGINWNLAPVVDVALASDNPIIKKKGRSFSSDPQLVARHAREFIKAHRRHGVATCAKHFPGHGSARSDTHLGWVDVTKTWTEEELFPFRRLATAGECAAIMTAHLFNARLDPDWPATLSRRTLHALLRRGLRFQGVVVSDDMQMKAISERYGLEEAVGRAVNAGVDMLCFGNNMTYDPAIGRKASDILLALVDSGKIAPSRIDQAHRRIQRMKQGIRLR